MKATIRCDLEETDIEENKLQREQRIFAKQPKVPGHSLNSNADTHRMQMTSCANAQHVQGAQKQHTLTAKPGPSGGQQTACVVLHRHSPGLLGKSRLALFLKHALQFLNLVVKPCRCVRHDGQAARHRLNRRFALHLQRCARGPFLFSLTPLGPFLLSLPKEQTNQ